MGFIPASEGRRLSAGFKKTHKTHKKLRHARARKVARRLGGIAVEGRRFVSLLGGAALLALPQVAQAQGRPVLLRDSFSIGSGDGVLCQVQDRSADNAVHQSSFDRAWSVVCRDSALPVANIWAFRNYAGDAPALVAPLRRERVDCSTAQRGGTSGLAGGDLTSCVLAGSKLAWSIHTLRRGGFTWVAEGFGAYDSATLLALRSLLDNRVAQGKIDAATTSVSDPAAFSRVQAQTLKPEQALAEGYRRNLSGDYAEAEAYFQALQERLESESNTSIDPVEFLANRALQKSNLGDFGEAERLFAQARKVGSGDPINERLLRNFEAIHQLNRGRPDRALNRLDQPLATDFEGLSTEGGSLAITIPIAARLNADRGSGVVGINTDVALTPRERVTIIDAQALQLRGTALRLMGRHAEARSALQQALTEAVQVRDGRVTTIARMRGQILAELGLVEEAAGNKPEAEKRLREGLTVVQAQYPERRAVATIQGRLASYLLRNGQVDEGLELYRGMVGRGIAAGGSATGFANELVPYFRSLTERMDSDPKAAEEFFTAAQLLVRPGVAETQAVLARELSGGSDEAARLFRQTTDLSRDIERLRIRYLALQRSPDRGAVAAEIDALAARLRELEETQATAQASLAAYPQYRAVAARAITLADFQKQLTEGEAYARVALVGPEVMMFYADRTRARGWRTPLSAVDLDTAVDLLRTSISVDENGRYVTYPFDLAQSRKLFAALFGPVEAELADVKHLIFEPDGALLRLPIDLLVTDDASVARYADRTAKNDADTFDFRGTAWLGRGRMISTATSAQSFVDARKARPSQARSQYLGLGNNAPIGANPPAAIRAVLAGGSDECGWAAAEWNRPIAADELVEASQVVGREGSQLLTGAAFTDTAVKQKSDLGDFRILHFATHGLVTPPRPNCPVKPALLTSFGATGSDGLLTFDEVFDLALDADLVILSACDTAGSASVEATRAAGLSTGGGTALDGLVRAFIGAGGRAVLASHWPAPDDYRATERLMNEMFRRGRTVTLGEALDQSEALLMDDAATSHPYYWAGFALIGDASKPLLRQTATALAQGQRTISGGAR